MNGFERRTKEKKEQVLNAAFDLMNTDKGASGLTIKAVAERSHISRATIFKYYESKQKLIDAVFVHVLDDIGETAMHIIESDLPFDQLIMALGRNDIEQLNKVSRQFYMELMASYVRDDHEISTHLDSYTQRAFNLMIDIFAKGRKEGKVDLKYSDEFLLLYFQALIRGISDPNIYGKILPYTEQWTEMMVKGFAPSKPAER